METIAVIAVVLVCLVLINQYRTFQAEATNKFAKEEGIRKIAKEEAAKLKIREEIRDRAQKKAEMALKEKAEMARYEKARKALERERTKEQEQEQKKRLEDQKKRLEDQKERATILAKKRTELKIQTMERGNRWELLRQNLPFTLSVKSLEGSLDDDDDAAWLNIKNAVDLCSIDKETLYFVRVKSLLDSKSYYKLGTTTSSVEDSFRRSTQVELEEVMAVHSEQKWLLLYAAYHLAREFKLTPELCDVFEINPSMLLVLGEDVTLRPNSTDKIVQLISDLAEAHKKIKVSEQAFNKEMAYSYQTIYDELYSE